MSSSNASSVRTAPARAAALAAALAAVLAAAFAAPGAAGSAAAAPPRPPVRPESLGEPAFTDLSGARWRKLPADLPRLAAVPLAADAAREILAAPAAGEDSKLQLRVQDDATAPSRKEKPLLAAEAGRVQRNGGRLVVTPAAGPPLLFQDVHRPGTKDADPDGTTYSYAGRLGAGRYFRVLAQFEHDAPGSYLVNPANGHAAFIHEYDDDVFLSPDGGHLLSWNSLNPPFTLAVASTGAAGPSFEALCRLGGKGVGSAEMKRWRGDGSVDLVLVEGEGKAATRVPLRLARTATGWQVEAPDLARLAAPDGFACFAGPLPPEKR